MTKEEITNAKILIVDDEEINVFLLKEVLTSANYKNLKSTTDSREAIKLYKTFSPDLVLLDINMPYLDGFEVMKLLKEIEKESYIPVLVLTAQTDDKTQKQALKLGAKDFLHKPFNIEETLARIHNLIEVRLLHNQLKNYNEILEKKVQERTQELNNSYLETVQRLVHLAEFRDNETGNHIIRMSNYSFLLAKALNLKFSECDLILKASPMHDIGKIGIPDNILLKPAKLNAEEWKIMKTHTTIGANVLTKSNSKLLQIGKIIALNHHEKWNGSGYPQGLKKENIPLVARLVTVCDVFDALTSKRPYKNAWSVEDSLIEMQKQKEKIFDPNILEMFIKILPEILEVKNTI